MPAKRDGYPVQVSLSQEDLDYLQETANRTEISKAEILRRITHAALKAIAANSYRITLPLRFAVIEEENGESKKKSMIHLRHHRVAA
jgi:hypothetical protein